MNASLQSDVSTSVSNLVVLFPELLDVLDGVDQKTVVGTAGLVGVQGKTIREVTGGNPTRRIIDDFPVVADGSVAFVEVPAADFGEWGTGIGT